MALATGEKRQNRVLISLIMLSVALIAVNLRVSAQADEIREYISGKLPVSNQNWKIYRNPNNGYVYFANSSGLVEYNGISARNYLMPFSKGVRSVCVSSGGRIFTGSFEEFGYWERNAGGDLYYQSVSQGIDIPPNDEIWNIYEHNHSIFFQSFTTIYRYDSSGVKPLPAPAIMLFLFRAGEQFMVQGIDKGLYWFDGDRYRFIPGSEPFGSMKVHAVIPVKPGQYWICTANSGIYLFDGSSFTYFRSELSELLKSETCNAGLALSDSLMVFGTILKGLLISDARGKVISTYDNSNGLNDNTVLSLHNDRQGGLWIGLDDGAHYFSLNSPLKHFADLTGNLGTIYSAIRENDMLYLGTNHGLYIAGIEERGSSYNFRDLRMVDNTQGQVWLLERHDGQILCGHNDGTFLTEGNSVRRISEVTGGWSMVEYNDLLLEGTYTGIISFAKDDDGKWSYRNRIAGYAEPSRSLMIDYLGYLWATHPQKGIYRLELNETADSVISVAAFSSIDDSNNRISISKINNQVVFLTSENIYAFDYEAGEFSPVRSLESGLADYRRATGIIPYQRNLYWFVMKNRIALFEISRAFEATLVTEFPQRFEELPGREQQIIPLDGNTMLIPARKSFTLFNISEYEKSSPGRPVVIDRVLFSGQASHSTIIPGTGGVPRIGHRENNVTIFLADPSELWREEREYLYRIRELGDNWHSTYTDNFSFLNLRFGHYHLQVKPVTGREITGFDFIIRRPFALSNTAMAAYLVLIVLAVMSGMSIFRRELQRQKQMLAYEAGKSRLESELDHKSYELMLTMRYLIRQNEIMTRLNDQISQLKERSSGVSQKLVREMEQIIRTGLSTQTEEWKNALNSLKLSQQGFNRRMLEKYPALTPNDLRLCSYLRMNFTTKEIAKLLNISGRAVEIARYRLRRKLQLDNSVNLTEFLIREGEGEE